MTSVPESRRRQQTVVDNANNRSFMPLPQPRINRLPCGPAAAVAVALATSIVLAACASSDAALPNLSATEQAFVQAAGTWDLDRDGVVTCDEWKTYARQLSQDADADHDGRLTRAEFASMAKVDRLFAIADFASFDANGDGFVTAAELTEKPNPAFKYLDKNNDCRIDTNEMPTQWGSDGDLDRQAGVRGRSGRGGH